MVTGPLVQTKPGFVWSNVLLVLLIVPLAERVVGSRQTLLVFFVGDWLSTLPILVVLRLLGAFGNAGALDHALTRDAGSSSGTWALAGALVAALKRPRLRYGVVGVALIAHLALWMIFRQIFDLQHLAATGVGFALATFSTSPEENRQ